YSPSLHDALPIYFRTYLPELACFSSSLLRVKKSIGQKKLNLILFYTSKKDREWHNRHSLSSLNNLNVFVIFIWILVFYSAFFSFIKRKDFIHFIICQFKIKDIQIIFLVHWITRANNGHNITLM